ncbi:MAG: ATP-binding protein [Coriobacteriales bacterium]
MGNLESNIPELTPTRIAVYDDLLSAPRVIDIEPTDIAQYIEEIAAKTYEFAQQKGSSIPYTVIKEVCENFIHAQFKDPCISILDNGNTIKFTDQGPGITDKQRAQLPGFTSATTEMRKYIRGVGSGLPTVKDYLRFSNGRLIIEDNIREGTVVTIQIDQSAPQATPVVYRETPRQERDVEQELSEREYNILVLAQEMGLVGPTEVEQNLHISLSTGHRTLNKLEDMGLLQKTEGGKKRMLTDRGLAFLNR